MSSKAIPIAVVSLGVLFGCSKKTEAPFPAGGRLVEMPLRDLAGLSGLARDDAGMLYAVPENDRFVVELNAGGQEQHRYRVSGVAEELEFESLAWLGKDRFAIGTEGGCKDGAEHVLIVTREGDGAKVAQDIKLPLAKWGMTCDEKRGVEGLCASGGQIVAAIENPQTGADGKRWAAIARIDEKTGEMTAYRIALTSKTGKISALDCQNREGNLDILGVERHFEVSQLIEFILPMSGEADEKVREPRVVLDMMAYVGEAKRNFEGVVWIDGKHVQVILDNKYGKVTGPNQMVEVELPGK
jgi:Esterase-like activity of phytase